MRYGREYWGFDRGRESWPRAGYDVRGGYGGPGSGRGRGAYGPHRGEARGPWTPRYEGYGYPAASRGGRREVAREVGVSQLMTPNPEAVTPDTPLMEVARRMRDLDVGIVPVVDADDTFLLRGVITDRDIAVRAAAEGKDMKKARVRDFMTSEVGTVDEGDGVGAVLALMKRDRVRRVPVTDGEGRLVGIIAQADLAVSYAGLDVEREAEVEEVIERISEPAEPRWGGESPRGRGGRGRVARARPYDHEVTDYLRDGWRAIRREAREFLGRGRPGGYDRGWW